MDRVSIESLVIGGGVIGLAVARQLALSGRKVILVEKENHLGEHSSSRNSEVIHAGLYYPTLSLKTQLCLQGRTLLYEYLKARNIPHRQCQKIIVAPHQNQEEALYTLYQKAQDNGVPSLSFLSQAQLRLHEPYISGTLGLLSKETGILDSAHYLKSLKREFLQSDGIIALNSPALSIRPTSSSKWANGFQTQIGGSSPSLIYSREVINCAGLWTHQLLQDMIQSRFIPNTPQTNLKATWVKGSYLRLKGQSPSQRLIYPLPQVGGLGIHLTIDLQGNARFGPDVEEITQLDYSIDFEKKFSPFFKSIRPIFPYINPDNLYPDYAGIRIKNTPLGEFSDFIFMNSSFHKNRGLIHACGIESPGLTASLAIAQYITHLLDQDR